ncbi:hypothetical protein E4K24_001998 [Enterococcus faecium]|nr:hypothetical protein [Enterococcus faecium]
MNILTEKQVTDLIKSANRKRNRYLKSDIYARDMCSLLLQNWNMRDNDTFLIEKPSTTPTIEFMAIYQQLLDIHPEEFEGRDIKKIKESIQKSIYGSIHTELFSNYINELKNNDQDSFLVVPVSFYYLSYRSADFTKRSDVAVIIQKQNNQINVQIYDKVQIRAVRPDEYAKKKNVHKNSWTKEEIAKLTPIYTYELSDVQSLVDVLRIGRNHYNWHEKAVPFPKYKKSYYIYNKLSKYATIEGYSSHVGTIQYVRDNSEIKNMNAALKYILGTKSEIIIDGKKFFQTKYKTLSTEKFNYVMNELMIMHLEKSGYGKEEVRNFISKAYDHYLDRKKEREQLPLENKKIHKVFWGDKYNNAIWTIPFVPRKEVVPESRHITGAEIKAIRNRCDQFDQKKVETLRKIIIDSNSKKNQRTQRDSQRQLNVSNGIK